MVIPGNSLKLNLRNTKAWSSLISLIIEHDPMTIYFEATSTWNTHPRPTPPRNSWPDDFQDYEVLRFAAEGAWKKWPKHILPHGGLVV